MDINVFYGILIPFLGTSAGAACVFFMSYGCCFGVEFADSIA